jgi:hypothetical protein
MLYNYVSCKQQSIILREVKEKPFRVEKDLQRLIEENLDLIFGLKLVKSECIIKNRKLDTLAFDPVYNTFAVIEYKKEKTISVFDQGIAYLKLMMENKAEIWAEYNENLTPLTPRPPLHPASSAGQAIERGSGSYSGRVRVGSLKRDDINWKGTRLIFVMPQFTENQVQAVEFWESLRRGANFR